MGYSNLQNYYKTIWAMAYHHKFSIADIENLIPFERDIYVDLTSNYIAEQEAAAKQASIF